MGVCRVIASAAPSQHIKRNYRKSIEKYDSNKTNENNKVNSSSNNNAKIARASLLTSTSRWRCDALTPPLSHNACLHAAALPMLTLPLSLLPLSLFACASMHTAVALILWQHTDTHTNTGQESKQRRREQKEALLSALPERYA